MSELYYGAMIGNITTLLHQFYNLSASEAENILDTEQKRIMEKINFRFDDNQDHVKIITQVITHQNEIILENNIKIPVPAINVEFRKRVASN